MLLTSSLRSSRPAATLQPQLAISLSASSGLVGVAVTVTGSITNPAAGDTTGTFAADVAGSWSNTNITLNSGVLSMQRTFTPSAAGTVTITLTGNNGAVAASPATYTSGAASPQLSISLSSPSGLVDTAVTATGSITNPAAGDTTGTFGANIAGAWSNTIITLNSGILSANRTFTPSVIGSASITLTGNNGALSATPRAYSSYSGSWPIDIAPGVFYQVTVATYPDGIPRGKHVTMAFCPLDNRMYFNGGDYSGSVYGVGSYLQDTWALDIAAWYNGGGQNVGWERMYPYAGYGGSTVQPKYPDHVGWTWDSNRSKFWHVPGTQVVAGSGNKPSGETDGEISDPNFIWYEPMLFDPFAAAASRWQRLVTAPINTLALSVTAGPRFTDTWMSVYDPVNDVILRSVDGPDVVAGLDVLDCSEAVAGNFPGAWSGTYMNAAQNNARLWKEAIAVDYLTRRCYQIDGVTGKLWRWSLDTPYTAAWEMLGVIPEGPDELNRSNIMKSSWDSVNNCLLHIYVGPVSLNRTGWTYAPGSGTSGTFTILPDPLPTIPATTMPVMAQCMGFDPVNNVHIMFTDALDVPWFLYRVA